MQLALKITLPLALLAFLALGASAWLSVREAVELHYDDVETDQRVSGRVLVAALERERANGSFDEGAGVLLDAANSDTQQTQLTALADVPLAHRAALSRGDSVVSREAWDSAETWLPVTLADGSTGALQMREKLVAERELVSRVITRHVINFVVLGLLWAAVGIGLGALVVGRPVRKLAAKARRVGQGDYTGRVAIEQNDELGELAREMNHMSEELLTSRDRYEAAQAQLRHADRLTTVGLLAAGIAHELGSPLNVVAGRAKMIAVGEVEGEAVTRNATIIHEQSQQMTRIIRQLLDFARRTPPTMTQFPLDAVATRSIEVLSAFAHKAKCTLALLPGDADVAVRGDPGQLEQVVTNLIINAVQAMPHGGPVTVQVTRARATPPADVGGPEGDYGRLSVADLGEGIPPDVLPRVFEPFFTTKQVGDGNGLGLPVAWGILRDHHGWIAVDSKPGEGARFSLLLPLAAPNA